MDYQQIGDRIQCGKARFSALSEGLIRLEWSATEQFTDTPTLCAFTRPNPIPFTSLSVTDDGALHLQTKIIHLIYHPSAEPFNDDNLQIEWETGNLSGNWTPSTLDNKNLGGTVASLDLVHRNLKPTGVHPANVEFSYPHTEEWLYTPLKAAHQQLRKQGETTRFENPPLWYLSSFRRRDLPPAVQTCLEQWQRFPPGILSASGYSVLNDSKSALIQEGKLTQRPESDTQDWYFFGYGYDYTQGLQDFVRLCGSVPMLPRWAFGVWFSLYDQMSDRDYQALCDRFTELELPLDVLLLDVDWHRSGWCGWDWNRELFPEPSQFLKWARDSGLHIGANVHVDGVSPEESQFIALCKARNLDPQKVKSGEAFPIKDPTSSWFFDSWHPEDQQSDTSHLKSEDGWLLFNLAQPDEAQLFMQELHQPREAEGIDFWWIDGSNAQFPGVNSQLWTNHVYWTHQAQQTQRRPLILSRTGGIGSHRYPVQFSADTYAHWDVLKFLVDFTTQAGNVGVSYWSHDLGSFFGHVPGVPIIDPELLVRWVQFGCFSPIVRFHSDHGRREPWHYGTWVLNAIRKALQLRVQLVPYLYHLSREAYETGLPLCRPLYLAYPEDREAYLLGTEYLFGDRILVAPVVEPGGYRIVYLPSGGWWERATHQFYAESDYLNLYTPLDCTPVFVKAGAILPLAESSLRVGTSPPETLVLEVYAGAEGDLNLYEDDGESTDYQNQEGSRRLFRQRHEGYRSILSCNPIQGSYRGMAESRTFKIRWIGLKPGSQIQVQGVEIAEQTWQEGVLFLALQPVAQTAHWQVAVIQEE
ncbi:MAG: DUF5110 domain-containing protein [Desertifilum sp. SIO1I2]|nr:DUF5110 domain-containing protein [Desertifilum sp. SIO1I2]